MASVYLMNGTNEVGMNGTNDYSTAQVGPNLNGSRRKRNMNGTNSVQLDGTNSVQLDGTNSVTLNGYEVEDLNPYEIELNGIEADDEDADAIRLALVYGDQAVIDAYEEGELNGLKEILAARKARLAAMTPEERAAKKAGFKKLVGGAIALASSAIPGASGVGSKIQALLAKGVDKAKVLQTAVEKAQILSEAGIDPEVKSLTFRAAQETDAGLEPPVEATGIEKLKQMWNGYSTPVKVAIIGGTALAGYLVYRQFFAKKKKRK